jgi:phage nucleotide-binding protein
VDELAVNRSYVFYGQSGSGKTSLAGTFPGKILVCDCRDRGTDSLVGVAGVEVKEIESWEDVEHVYWYLKKNPEEFATVVWDTMSQLQQICIEAVLEEKGKDADDAGGWGVMTKQEWGNVASRMKPMITNFRDLPMDVIFIAQHRVFNLPTEDEEEAGTALLAPEVGPMLMPSVAKHLNASVSVIGNTFIRTRLEEVARKVVKGKGKAAKTTEVIDEVEHIEYCLRIGPSSIYTTKVRKSRDTVMPDIIVDPEYADIMKILRGTA